MNKIIKFFLTFDDGIILIISSLITLLGIISLTFRMYADYDLALAYTILFSVISYYSYTTIKLKFKLKEFTNVQ